MPRPNKGGKKRSRGRRFRNTKKGALVLKNEDGNIDQLYGKVTKKLGGRPAIVLVNCEDGVERKCVVRGKMHNRKGQIVDIDRIVLINYNKDSDETGGEIEHLYNNSEIKQLKNMDELKGALFKSCSNISDNDITFSEISNTAKVQENPKPIEDDFEFDFEEV